MAARRKVDACDNYTDDAAWDRRHKHRIAGLAAVHRSRDYFAMLSLIATGEASADWAPLAPGPDDRACSKRTWERRMQAWRAAVKNFVLQAEQC
jgi:hypothetical protein